MIWQCRRENAATWISLKKLFFFQEKMKVSEPELKGDSGSQL
jgi:hypothetical protein